MIYEKQSSLMYLAGVESLSDGLQGGLLEVQSAEKRRPVGYQKLFGTRAWWM